MSTRPIAAAPRTAASWALIAFGLAALWLRLDVVRMGDASRVWSLAAIVAAVAIASLLPHVRSEPSRLAPWAVTAIGVSGVVAVSVIVGRPPGFPAASASVPLAVGAAVAEEALFRRLAYDRLLWAGAGTAVVATAVAFALIHVPLYGWAAFPVDLGAGLVLSWQRYASGDWRASGLTHVIANLLAGASR